MFGATHLWIGLVSIKLDIFTHSPPAVYFPGLASSPPVGIMDFTPSPCCQQRYELFTLAIKSRLHNADDVAYISYRISTGACAFDTMGSFFTAANHHQPTYSCAITSSYRGVRGFRTNITPPPATTWVLLALTLGMFHVFFFLVDRHRQLHPSLPPPLPQLPSAQGFFPQNLLAYAGLPFLITSSSASTT